MDKGIVYWITGLSGAGKTTIGTELYYKLREKKNNVVLLDGDTLKRITAGGYSEEERLNRAYKYCNLCEILSVQGIDVIICTIAMYDEIREWNRKNIEKYIEIFIDVDEDVLLKRNQKGLYDEGSVNVVGRDLRVEFPKKPDIVIKNNGDESIESYINTIIEYEYKKNNCVNHDENYWNIVYANSYNNISDEPSEFAKYVFEEYIEQNKKLIDFGCGNGRDSLFFAKNNVKIVGIDSAESSINKLKQFENENCKFICDDFISYHTIVQTQADYCYCRFVLHAITLEQEEKFIRNVYQNIKEDGLFFIEARTVNDGKYGLGRKIGYNEYIYDNHYRRFLVLDELIKRLEKVGFCILKSEESNRFAPGVEEKCVCLRIVAKKL